MWLANSVGHGSLDRVSDILNKTAHAEDDELAYLAMHYIDDYTSGSDWVGEREDLIEKRMLKNEANPRYRQLNEDGRTRLSGRTTFEAMREVGLLVQERLSREIAIRSGEYIKPHHLPVRIDEIIRERISQVDK